MKKIFTDLHKMRLSKKGLNEGSLNTAITAIILLVVLFKLYAALVPEAQTAGDELNDSGVPLGSLFTADGVIFIVIMASLVIVVIRSVLSKSKK